jgi:LemA protein
VDVENDIESARRYYNGTVRELNIAIESFPSNLVANQFGFTQAEFFKLRLPSVKQTPKVEL